MLTRMGESGLLPPLRGRERESVAGAPWGEERARRGRMRVRLEVRTWIGRERRVERRVGMTETMR